MQRKRKIDTERLADRDRRIKRSKSQKISKSNSKTKKNKTLPAFGANSDQASLESAVVVLIFVTIEEIVDVTVAT